MIYFVDRSMQTVHSVSVCVYMMCVSVYVSVCVCVSLCVCVCVCSLVVEGGTQPAPITSLVQQHLPDATISRAHGHELVYTLPLHGVSRFAGTVHTCPTQTGRALEM